MKQMLFVGGYKTDKTVLAYVSQDKPDQRICHIYRAVDTVRNSSLIVHRHIHILNRLCPSCKS